MHLFRDKLEKAFPVIKKYYLAAQGGVVRQYYSLRDGRDKNFNDSIHIPYITETVKYLKNCGGRLNKRILLVTESEAVAIKSAAYIKEHMNEYTDELYDEYDDYADFMDYYGDDDTEEAFVVDDKLRVIDFDVAENDEKIMGNRYLRLLSEVSEDDMVLFKGLHNEEDINDKLEVIGACPAYQICVYIEPGKVDAPWVQQLLMDLDCDVLELSPYTNKYCLTVLDYLLKGESYKLPDNISAEKLIQIIRKRRGRQFREEDIAWYLDKGLKGLAVGEKSPMDKLESMTGLEDVKELAKELAALAREERVNDKLGTLHKNMIFTGNPGTGKTTSAELLANIMADAGSTNAHFVVADRKSLIGKYVGHTAPNIAKKFEEAKGGVLFIDEAGFFLNENAGGYVEEAVKEFVRYMELYPDVTVIFAMYLSEVERFLELDAGLASRISYSVKFRDYSTDELTDIAVGMLVEKGYSVSKAVRAAVSENIEKMRMTKKKCFGNAREARKLAEAVITMASIRKYETNDNKNSILAEDVKKSLNKLCPESDKQQNAFGFQTDVCTYKKTILS